MVRLLIVPRGMPVRREISRCDRPSKYARVKTSRCSSGMPELKEEEYYEMWYYAENGSRISCGTFRVGPEGRTTVKLSAPATAGDYPEIEVTREPDDGNPEASGKAVLEGRFRSS